MKNKVFDPEKSFFELPIVIWTFSIIVGFAIITAIFITYSSSLSLNTSYTGFNQFVTFFKVPLGILASAIPIVAVYATNHRSEQTKKQIEIANSQNNFINHFKHIEEFEKYVHSHFSKSLTQLYSPRKTYQKLFPNSHKGDFTLSEELMSNIESASQNIVTCLIEINKDNINSISDPEVLFSEIETKAEKLLYSLDVSYTSDWGAKYEYGEFGGKSDMYVSSKLWFKELQSHFDTILQILNFSLNQKLPSNFNALVSIKAEELPDIKNLFNDKEALINFLEDKVCLWDRIRNFELLD